MNPTKEQRDIVIRMAKANIDPDLIARSLGISLTELKAEFPTELREGSVNAVAEIAQRMYEQALNGHFPSQKFYLEVLGGWQTKTDKDKVGDRAHPFHVILAPNVVKEKEDAGS